MAEMNDSCSLALLRFSPLSFLYIYTYIMILRLDAGLAGLQKLVNLQDLDLAFCFRLTDAGLQHLKNCTQLTRLLLEVSTI